MYKVLIADDNSITRKSIMLTIDWNELNCEVITDAGNGIEALDFIKKHSPDIIITDIKMPGMDGLKLTEKAKALYPWIKVIIITGYNDFTYAQEAIRLGAFDLILKPIDNKELCGIIKKAVNLLNGAKKEQMRQEVMRSAIEKNRDQIKAKMIIDIIEGEEIPETYISMQSQRKFFIFSVNYRTDFNDPLFKKSILQSKQAVESLKTKYDYDFTYFWLNNSFTIMILEKGKTSFGKIKNDIQNICCSFQNLSELTVDYTIGVSRLFSRYEEIKEAYNESIYALGCRFFFSGKKIICADSVKTTCILNEYTFLKKIYDCIDSQNLDTLDHTIDEIREIIIAETPSISSVKNFLSSTCTIALDIFINKKGYRFDQYKNRAEINDDINEMDSLDSAIDYVKNFIGKLFINLENDFQGSYSKVTLQVIDYLNEHYNKKISLQEISDYVSLTPSHLSRVIKKDTGKCFVDLFNNIKINVAEKLLKESNLKVYEVANRVGIDNYSYFYQLFKKITGIAPTEYYNKRPPDKTGIEIPSGYNK